MEDDTWNGYFIPKGATVFTKIWQIHLTYNTMLILDPRDPTYLQDPSSFKPDRWLNSEHSDPEAKSESTIAQARAALVPRHFVFGFGRRECLGNELALHSLWTAGAMTLWAFEIRPVRPEEEGGAATLE
ncbi:hypothetical protein FRC01_012919, partial [Tulasnella sp. 417]